MHQRKAIVQASGRPRLTTVVLLQPQSADRGLQWQQHMQRHHARHPTLRSRETGCAAGARFVRLSLDNNNNNLGDDA